MMDLIIMFAIIMIVSIAITLVALMGSAAIMYDSKVNKIVSQKKKS